MSTPKTSVSPGRIQPSDNWNGGGEGVLLRLSRMLDEWLAARSPASATVADTDWVNLTPATGFTATSTIQVCRIDREIFWRGRVNRTAGAFAAGTEYTVVDANGVPAWARPISFADAASTINNGGGGSAYATVTTDGAIRLTAIATAANNYFLKPLSGYLVAG